VRVSIPDGSQQKEGRRSNSLKSKSGKKRLRGGTISLRVGKEARGDTVFIPILIYNQCRKSGPAYVRPV